MSLFENNQTDKSDSFQPLNFDWITIPAGSFLMGSDSNLDKCITADDRYGTSDELPQHEIALPEYRISKFPITNRQYKVFVCATGYDLPPYWQHHNSRIPDGKEEHPVNFVSWYDVNAFCGWASETFNIEVRLPTEVEWEKAARGVDGRIFVWGDGRWPQRGSGTRSVGYYSPACDSPYGVADMVGCVEEWTSSKYRTYPYLAEDGREDQEGDEDRVTRGTVLWGYHTKDSVGMRCAHRDAWHPSERDDFVGFRVAQSCNEGG